MCFRSRRHKPTENYELCLQTVFCWFSPTMGSWKPSASSLACVVSYKPSVDSMMSPAPEFSTPGGQSCDQCRKRKVGSLVALPARRVSLIPSPRSNVCRIPMPAVIRMPVVAPMQAHLEHQHVWLAREELRHVHTITNSGKPAGRRGKHSGYRHLALVDKRTLVECGPTMRK